MRKDLEEMRLSIAQDMFERYDFGDDATVSGSNGWEADGNDFIKVAYLEFDDEESPDGSEKVSFHVKFSNNSTDVDDVYALMVRNGAEIGSMPITTKNKNKI